MKIDSTIFARSVAEGNDVLKFLTSDIYVC